MERRNNDLKGCTLTYRQICAVLFILLLSPIIRLLPGDAAPYAKKGTWLTPLAAAPLLYILAAVMNRFMKNASPGEGLCQVIIKAAGKAVGKIFLAAVGLWLVFYTGILVRTSAERLISTVYPTGTPELFGLTILIVSLIMALGNLKSLGRMSEIFLGIIGTVLVITVLAVTRDCKAENLLPVTGYDVPGIFMGAVPVINAVALGTYITFLNSDIKGKKGKGYVRLFVILAVIAALSAVTVGALSWEITGELRHPFFVAVRNISIFGMIERIEAIVIVLWVISDLVYLTVILKVIGGMFYSVLERGSKNIYSTIGAVLSVIPAFFVFRSAFSVDFFSKNIALAVNILITVILVPLLFVVGLIRKKI